MDIYLLALIACDKEARIVYDALEKLRHDIFSGAVKTKLYDIHDVINLTYRLVCMTTTKQKCT
jgi:hypothetical protein